MANCTFSKVFWRSSVLSSANQAQKVAKLCADAAIFTGSSATLVKQGCRQRRSLEAVSSKAASFHQEQSYSGKSKADEPSQA